MSLLGKISWAKDASTPMEYIERIKRSVAEEFHDLDASAEIIDTHYFNHTAIPDFVVKWPGEKAERRVFLRESYDTVTDADDADYLSGTDSVLMALTQRGSARFDEEETITPTESRLLITDAAAVDSIPNVSPEIRSPMTAMVRANFLRGAKGHMDQRRVEQLAAFSRVSETGDPFISRQIIGDNFTSDAALRIERAANIIKLALSPNYTDDEVEHLGRLSTTEVMALLPWLLGKSQARENSRFWRYFGEMISFADLENLREELRELDLDALISANAMNWSAKRAAFEQRIDEKVSNAEDDAFWSFEGGALGINLGDSRLVIVQKGTMLKSRPVEFTPSWSKVLPLLEEFKLSGVDLRGIQRSISLNAEENPDIRSDVEEVTQSLGDSYFVNKVTLKVTGPPETEGDVEVDVRFNEDLVVAPKGAKLGDLATIALRVLAYRGELAKEKAEEVIQHMKLG